MAYALVAWRRDGDEDEAAEAFAEISSVPFFRGLFLVRKDGPEWSSVRESVQEVVEELPGTEAMIFMPAKGARAGGWVKSTPSADDLKAARKIMNRSGSSTVPSFYAIPPVDEGGS